MDGENNKCGHDSCVCAVADDQDYCSTFCENAGEGDITVIKCDCGHPGCE